VGQNGCDRAISEDEKMRMIKKRIGEGMGDVRVEGLYGGLWSESCRFKNCTSRSRVSKDERVLSRCDASRRDVFPSRLPSTANRSKHDDAVLERRSIPSQICSGHNGTMHKGGAHPRAIGVALGRTVPSVRYQLTRHGKDSLEFKEGPPHEVVGADRGYAAKKPDCG
jgi:hypothetical protein